MQICRAVMNMKNTHQLLLDLSLKHVLNECCRSFYGFIYLYWHILPLSDYMMSEETLQNSYWGQNVVSVLPRFCIRYIWLRLLCPLLLVWHPCPCCIRLGLCFGGGSSSCCFSAVTLLSQFLKQVGKYSAATWHAEREDLTKGCLEGKT